MGAEEGAEPLGIPAERPLVTYSIESDELQMSWENTRLRMFRDEQFNHVEHFPGDGTCKGIRDQELMDVLFEQDYPFTFHPEVDEATMEWMVSVLLEDVVDYPPDLDE